MVRIEGQYEVYVGGHAGDQVGHVGECGLLKMLGAWIDEYQMHFPAFEETSDILHEVNVSVQEELEVAGKIIVQFRKGQHDPFLVLWLYVQEFKELRIEIVSHTGSQSGMDLVENEDGGFPFPFPYLPG